MVRLIPIDGIESKEPIELKEGANRLGRNPENDVTLGHPSVSGRHCEIVVQGGQAMVRDLGSTNGTYIEGGPVQGTPTLLQSGQVLQMGDVVMRYEASQEARVVVPGTEPMAEAAPELEEGMAPCRNHATAAASWVCTQCGNLFCNVCVHHLRRTGGKFLNLCPDCGNPCKLHESVGSKKKKSFLGTLRDWLKQPARR